MAKGVECVNTRNETKRRFLESRREADAILATNGNRLLLIEAILILSVFIVLFVSFKSASSLLLSAVDPKNKILAFVLTYLISLFSLSLGLLFVTPIALGLFRLAEQIQAGKNPVLLDLFYFLSSRKRYVQCLLISWRGGMKILTMIVIVYDLNLLFPKLAPDTAVWHFLHYAAVILTVCLFSCITLFPYSGLYRQLRYKIIDDTDEWLISDLFDGVRFVRFFLPWLLLGLLSFGLLLVLDVFPRMLLTYFCDCNRKEFLTDP